MPKNSSPDDADPSNPQDMGDILKELDREESRIVVRLEMRKFRKPTTVVEGLSRSQSELEDIARKLKQTLATGGTAKQGLILLQGDQRDGVHDQLIKLGYPKSSIEVQ